MGRIGGVTVFREHQMVELTRPVGGTAAGTRGVVVGVYGNGGYEVEFIDDGGETVDVVTVAAADLRAVD
jgi:hypothetical protein